MLIPTLAFCFSSPLYSWILHPMRYVRGVVVVRSSGLGRFLWCVYPCPSRLLHWHWGKHMIAPVPVKQPLRIWVKLTVRKNQQSTNRVHNSWDVLYRDTCTVSRLRPAAPGLVEQAVTRDNRLVRKYAAAPVTQCDMCIISGEWVVTYLFISVIFGGWALLMSRNLGSTSYVFDDWHEGAAGKMLPRNFVWRGRLADVRKEMYDVEWLILQLHSNYEAMFAII